MILPTEDRTNTSSLEQLEGQATKYYINIGDNWYKLQISLIL